MVPTLDMIFLAHDDYDVNNHYNLEDNFQVGQIKWEKQSHDGEDTKRTACDTKSHPDDVDESETDWHELLIYKAVVDTDVGILLRSEG